jgi:holo-[acyl-carrier protein] synthase
MRVGIDMIEIDRVRSALARRPAQHFAARFAGKEAVGKAIGCGVEFMWRDIEIAGRPKPTVRLSGRVAELAERFGAGEIDLSMTHSRGMAAAVAIVQPR